MPPIRRVATETVTADIDGVNTVVAEAGQVVPLGYDHLVPDSKAEPVTPGVTRSTAGRRAAAAAASTVETDPGRSYDDLPVEQLQAEADRRGLDIEGTGKDGNVLKADLVTALQAHDDQR